MNPMERIIGRRARLSRDIRHPYFKSNMMSYYLLRPLSLEEASLGALLGKVLSAGSLEYPNLSSLGQMQDDLYGAVLYFDMNKFRDHLVFEYKMITPNYELLPVEDDFSERAYDFFASVLKKPLLKDGRFVQEIFENEKQKLMDDMENLKKNPSAYAFRRLVQVLYGDHPLGIYKYGDSETLAEINNGQLVDYYHDLLESDFFCYRHGNFKERLDSLQKEEVEIKPLQYNTTEIQEEEEQDINQSILVKAYTTPIELKDEAMTAVTLFNHMLGGTGNSALFREIREKQAFCYSIYSKLDKYRSVLFVSTAYQEANHEALEQALPQVLESFCRGDFLEDDLFSAKQELIQQLRSLRDRQMSLLDYQFLQDLFQMKDDLKQREAKLQAVTAEEIVAVAQSFRPTASFHLKGGQ